MVIVSATKEAKAGDSQVKANLDNLARSCPKNSILKKGQDLA